MVVPRRVWPYATFALILVNVVIYLAVEWMRAHRVFSVDWLLWYFGLHLQGLRHGYWWQLITFQFLHAPLMHPLSATTFSRLDFPWHLLLNCWGIFVFGPPLERTLGRTRFFSLYLLSGIAGGALQILASILSFQRFGGPVVGASAGVFGLVAAFTQLFPEAQMTVLLFFVIPLRMTANRMLTVAALLTVFGMIAPQWIPGGNVAHAAHLGGLIAGVVFVWLFTRRFRRDTTFAT
jgi:membrane associated rhomboid family serine protease